MVDEEKKEQLNNEPEDIFSDAEITPPPKADQPRAEKAEKKSEELTPASPKPAASKSEVKSEAQPPTKPPTKKMVSAKVATGKVKKIVKLVIIVIIVIVIGFGIFYGMNTFLKSKKTGSTMPTVETEPNVESTIKTNFSSEILDSDGDGLSDTKERELRTNRNNSDSDNDGLFDKEEVDIYKTDPLESDTDADGTLDGDEINQGTDPNDPTPGALLLDLQKAIESLK